ncbi:chloride channel protein [Paenibacillus ihuae]|uniref:chloride channel protein n=1 Tax=Paenibacillus ihuae TaxID=1232431 RepID=UPI0006D58996|nr:chloride channel protein [Paenibacillus ihuae]
MKTILTYKNVLKVLSIWIIIGGLIGTVVGSLTSLLLETNDFLGKVREANTWLIALLPLGGIAVGFLYMRFGKSILNNTLHDSAEGNNLVIDSVNGNKKVLRRMGPIVYLGTFITVFFGGSTGREGAAIQMGGSVAEAANRWLKVKPADTLIMLMSGISAGFGAAFGAPITGAVFGMEMAALGKLKFEAVVPCLVASFAAHFVTEEVWGVEHEKFIIQTLPGLSMMTFLKVVLAAVIFGLLSVVYSQLRHGIQKYSEKLFKKSHIKRAFVGGLLIAGFTLLAGSQDYNGRSLDLLEQSFKEDVPPFAFLAKLVFTAVTLGTGFVGGEAIPLFIMGATLGNSLHHMIGLPMSFLAALGLVATFCGGANTPISAFLLAMEFFGEKGAEYFFVACVVSYIVSGHHGLWPSQTVHEPKSRLYQVAKGDTIGKIEQRKK